MMLGRIPSTMQAAFRKVVPLRSLALKLALAFLAVSLTGIGLIVLLAANVSAHEFGRFVNSQRQDSLASGLSTYYQQHSGWSGVAAVFASNAPATAADPVRPLVLVDSHENVVFSTDTQFQDQKPSAEQVAIGVPIWADGQLVGLLIPTFPSGPRRPPPALDYIGRINQNLLYGTLAAAALSLVLGLLLASNLIRPVRDLIAATRDVAQGNLEREVPVRSKDEIGALTESFNLMSSQLKRGRDLRRNMTADIAHELRTPLSIILGHTEALSEGKLQPTAETFYILHDEAQHLSLLVEDLRTLSLSEAGELTLTLQPAAPAALVERIISAYQPRARALTIRLSAQVDPHLPEINVDPNRITQVFENILDNAFRYTPAGGRVELSAHVKAGGVEFKVHDSGRGIAPVDLPHIFDRFYRDDRSRSRQDGGSGLGLAISKSIIEAHGGQIWAESDQGATIAFLLPAHKE